MVGAVACATHLGSISKVQLRFRRDSFQSNPTPAAPERQVRRWSRWSRITIWRRKRVERREDGQHLRLAEFGGADKAAYKLPGADCFLAEFDGIHCQLRIVVLKHVGQGAALLLCQLSGFSPAIKIFKCHRFPPATLFSLHSPLFALPDYGTLPNAEKLTC